jgi:hypothetical protein
LCFATSVRVIAKGLLSTAPLATLQYRGVFAACDRQRLPTFTGGGVYFALRVPDPVRPRGSSPSSLHRLPPLGWLARLGLSPILRTGFSAPGLAYSVARPANFTGDCFKEQPGFILSSSWTFVQLFLHFFRGGGAEACYADRKLLLGHRFLILGFRRVLKYSKLPLWQACHAIPGVWTGVSYV